MELLDKSRKYCVSGNFRNATSTLLSLPLKLGISIASDPALHNTRPNRDTPPDVVRAWAAICIHIFNGDSFDDIFSAHILKHRKKTGQKIVIVEMVISIDIHDDVLQSLHRRLQHISEAAPAKGM